ncbi:haloacid dehalogenase superfamily, subfamily IA, variant 3 with third motif having DD or ED [Saccharomonospora viridis]|uniref:HAD family hydrolase n=1 Tax=Saccharomonospora viridis TaxID=1852 RepID=A0A837DDN2_9PSEU|nr:HAD family hydrolase [Saccharomonospora viridis]SFP23159.1 haloacid dehalogenase superfamily, subfamily IA, variant 3 with third motif having DD or ED [Saccharomonospora viridis]
MKLIAQWSAPEDRGFQEVSDHGVVGTVSRVDAVVFDLDGVLVDSERMWDEVRRSVVAEHGGRWREEATRTIQGMSTPEWARYLVEELGTRLTADEVADTVIREMAARYESGPPIIAGAEKTVRAVAERYSVAIASSSPPTLIDAFLSAARLTDLVRVAVSSEQVDAGKPAPDVYLEAARRLEVAPVRCAAVEDSTNGLRSALAARMTVIGVPNPHYPPDPNVLAEAHAVIDDITELPETLSRIR